MNKMKSPQVCAYLSDLVYWDNLGKEKVESILKEEGFLDVLLFENKTSNTEFITAIYDNKRYFSFRGTNSSFDWLININGKKVKRPYVQGKVHAGFYYSVSSIWSVVETILNNNDLPIVVCGHSKGGAEAQITAGIIKGFYKKNVELHCFGTAYVGNRKFAKSLKYANFYINNSDPVPRYTNIFFSNFGNRFYFNVYGEVKLMAKYFYKLFDRYKDGISDSISDHDISIYHDLVEENILFIESNCKKIK